MRFMSIFKLYLVIVGRMVGESYKRIKRIKYKVDNDVVWFEGIVKDEIRVVFFFFIV